MPLNKFRVLYQFEVPIVKEVDETVVSRDDQGNEVKTTKKVKKTIQRKAVLKKPTRSEQDDALLYYNVMVNDGIKKGLIPKINLTKIYDNDGGTMSKPEEEEYGKLYRELYEKMRVRQQLSAIDVAARSEDETKQLNTLIEEEGIIKRQLQTFEASQSAIYDITAENRARTKTIMWWLLNLCYFDEKYEQTDVEPVWRPVFPGKEFEDKMEVYDEIEDGESLTPETKDYYFKLIQKAVSACAFWYYGRASAQADFEFLEKELVASVETGFKPTVPTEDKPAETTPEVSPEAKAE